MLRLGTYLRDHRTEQQTALQSDFPLRMTYFYVNRQFASMNTKRNLARNSPSKSNQPLKWVPENLAKQVAICISCGQSNKPSWTALTQTPFVPVKPNDTPANDPGRWVIEGHYSPCGRCGQRTAYIDIPTKKLKAKVFLYGDDAERFCKDPPRYVFMYSLIGASAPVLPRLSEAVREVKKCLIPSKDPQTWKLHMKVLTSGQKRESDPLLSNINREQINCAVGALFEILNSSRELWIYNLSMLGAKSSATKHDAYTALLALAIDEITNQGGGPVVRLDSEKSSPADKIIHGWAREIFNNSQRSLLYAFLAKGIEIPEPEFVQPGSHPCLELADFISYIVARYYHCRWNNLPLEWDPQKLGKVTYAGFENSGDLRYQRCAGYPWELFYG